MDAFVQRIYNSAEFGVISYELDRRMVTASRGRAPDWKDTALKLCVREVAVIDRTKTVVLILCMLALSQRSAGQATDGNYELRRFSVDNGGGVSSGQGFSVTGSIAQADASARSFGGQFAASGGFWGLAAAGNELFSNGFE